MIRSAKFIEFPAPFDPAPKEYDPAPIFKKQFTLNRLPQKAELQAVALGLGCIYINGKPITKDVFNTPCGNYLKTLWYHTYEVASLLKEGENEITVIVGNGWYNEFLKTGWDFDKAQWRGAPKLLFALDLGSEKLFSDESWVVSREASPVVYNQLRSGEVYDCRRGEAFLGYGAEGYIPVKLSEDAPSAVLRPCPCQPIREFESYTPVATFKNAEGRVVYDFGQNLSGYLNITLRGK
ncbi:MAG: alpha-L-rhamnosidase N-terminal domain-containing protein, partial [Acutalibacteraceae bacterium]|nr:alpha-L-rhamnosidase N-terminal domain-containing protein [Acutalibacteraceae bacterium]